MHLIRRAILKEIFFQWSVLVNDSRRIFEDG